MIPRSRRPLLTSFAIALVAGFAVLVPPAAATAPVEPVTSTPAQGQRSAADPLTEIRDELRQIVRLLSDQTEIQRSSLIVERLRIEAEAIQHLEDELQKLTREREDLDSSMNSMEQQVALDEESLRRQAEQAGGNEDAREQLAEMRQRFDQMRDDFARRLSALDTRIITLQNDLDRRSVRYETLSARVDELLGVDG